MTGAEMWDRLRADGLVEGDQPGHGRPSSPWYVRAMLGIAGWLGALFLMAFMGAAFAAIWRDGSFALVAGGACCAAAFALFRAFRGHDFVDQFALAVSITGQILLVLGLGQLLQVDDPGFYFAVAATQAALALAILNFLHRLLAACGTAIALALGIVQLSLHGFAAPLICVGLAFIWLDPARWARNGGLWRPVGYGLVLALLLIETFQLLGGQRLFGLGVETHSWTGVYGPLAGRGLTAAVLLWVAVVLARREGFEPASRTFLMIAGGALLIGLLSLNAPGLASALLVLLLGFATGNRLLMALGVVSLLGFVTHFYYSLYATLLEKSGMLALTGLCLLAAHLIVRRVGRGAEEPAHA